MTDTPTPTPEPTEPESQSDIDNDFSYNEEQQAQLGKDLEEVFANGQTTRPSGEVVDSEPEGEAGDGTEGDAQEPDESNGGLSAPEQSQPGSDSEPEETDTETADDANASINPVTIGNQEYSPVEAVQMQQTHEWAKNLAPEHVTAINALMSGDYVLVLRDQDGVDKAPVAEDSQEEYIDPRAASEIDKLNAKLADIEAYTQTQQQQQIAQTQVQQQAAIDQGLASFREKYDLDDNQLNNLQSQLVDAQILPGLAASIGNVTTAIETGLEQMYWSDETFRQRELDKRIASEQVRSQEQKSQRRKASSLHGSGGSVSRNPAAPATKQERESAMVEEIAAHMNSGQTS